MFTTTAFRQMASLLCLALPLGAASAPASAEDLPVGLSSLSLGTPEGGYAYSQFGSESDIMNFRDNSVNWHAAAFIGFEFLPEMRTRAHQREAKAIPSGYEIDFSIERYSRLWTDLLPKTYRHEVMLAQYVDYETDQPTDLSVTFDRMVPGIWTERWALVVVRDQDGSIEPTLVTIPVASQWRFELPSNSVGRIEVYHFYVKKGSVSLTQSVQESDWEELKVRISFSNPSDIDQSGDVDGQDLTALLSRWAQECDGCAEDINDDGIVNAEDLTRLLAAWNGN